MNKEYFKIVDGPKYKTSELLQQCRDKFNVYSFYRDTELDQQFTPPKQITIRYFKKNVEADKEFLNKSYNDLQKEGIEGITLRERIIMELQYFNETGKHLNIDTVTLCSGSRVSGGSVPYAGWCGGEFEVGWCSPDGGDPIFWCPPGSFTSYSYIVP